MAVFGREFVRPLFVRPYEGMTITAQNEEAGSPVSHLGVSRHSGLVWRSTSSFVEVTIDLGAAKPIDFIALLDTNATPTTALRIRIGDTRAEVDGTADYDQSGLIIRNPAVSLESGKYHSFHKLESAITKRWIKITISGHSGPFEASHLVIGESKTPEYYPSPDFEFGGDDETGFQVTAGGIASGADDLPNRTLRINFPWMTESDYETYFRHLAERHGVNRPFYMCQDPAETSFRMSRMYFGYFPAPPVTSATRIPTIMQFNAAMVSLI